ncbi:MAG: hypothetical protein JWQ87_1042 [Candidatus Sulfotelmatobacter sp.]|jgi:hypothetical protein|nr:hypothetical protein [Candidatus Sulfotelmatobacter sp.]
MRVHHSKDRICGGIRTTRRNTPGPIDDLSRGAGYLAWRGTFDFAGTVFHEARQSVSRKTIGLDGSCKNLSRTRDCLI